MIIPLSKLT